MKKSRFAGLSRFLLPFGALGAALLLHISVWLVLPKSYAFPYPIFYSIAILAVAWQGGYVSGVITSLTAMVGLPYLANHHFRLSSVDPTRLGMTLVISLLVSKLASSQRRVQEILRDANAELDERVRSRTLELKRSMEGAESEVERRKKSEQKLQTQLGRVNLLDQITRAIGERQDLGSVFRVVVQTLEDSLPIDFGCICLYNSSAEILTVSCVGAGSEAIATEISLTEKEQIAVGQNGLARCVSGALVYEPDVTQLDSPFSRRIADGGLRSIVAGPLLAESNVFGILLVGRREPDGFSSGDCEFLRQLSEHVALAANQARIYAALQQAYDDLRRTQQAIMEQERLRVLGQMASGIAHDINNALSPVALYTESLLDSEPNLSARARQYLEITQRAIEDVSHTVARLREFYRKPELQLRLTVVDMNRLVEQVLDLTRVRWNDMPQQRGAVIRVSMAIEKDLPPVLGVESEIREALTNLIFNAVDAMPDGGTLTLCTRTVGDPAFAAQRRVHVEVTDTGSGMDEETRRRCIEPFFTTKGERGTGLGLAMVYGVAQRQNAELEIQSTTGRGTTVRLNFPVTAEAAGSKQPSHALKQAARLRILVVDDDPLIIKSLRDTLTSDGHIVVTANGGQEGIDTFRSGVARNEDFDVVITDLGMPYIDGRQVANAVKSTGGATSVILLTGWGKRLVAEGDVPANVDRVLSKPPKLQQLRTTLAELVPETLRGSGVSREGALV